MRAKTRDGVGVAVTMLALVWPLGLAGQGPDRVRVQPPPTVGTRGAASGARATAKEAPARTGRAPAAPAARDRDDRRSGDRARADERRERTVTRVPVRWDDDRRPGSRDDDRWDERRWDRERAAVQRWSVRSEADLRLFGFLGLALSWDRHDRDDRARWLDRYRRYDVRHRGFSGGLDGWLAPRWGDAYFERDPLRYGPRPLDHRELRQLLDRATWDRIRRGTPGGTGQLWGRVERFGPGGRATTLEVWSGERFVAALTDFDRDGWIDDIVVNRRYWR